MFQQTIKNNIAFKGIGLHTGRIINVRISPAEADTGIVFIRKDLAHVVEIKADAAYVVGTNYATTLGSNGASVSTVEHLLAAFYGLGVDNAAVEIDGPEIPIMDGSASDFAGMIEHAGLKRLSCPRSYIVINKPIRVGSDDKYAMLLPCIGSGFSIDYSIDFSHDLLKNQSFARNLTKDIFRKEIGSARTFGFLRDVEMLMKNGLAKGGSLKNAVVLSDTDILNEEGLRYPDEFVRHKVLDLIGDISLVGARIIGRLKAVRSGHTLNHLLVKETLVRNDAWEMKHLINADAFKRPCNSFLGKVAAV